MKVATSSSAESDVAGQLNPQSKWARLMLHERVLYQSKLDSGRTVNSRKAPPEGVRQQQQLQEKDAEVFERAWQQTGKTDADIEAGLINLGSDWIKYEDEDGCGAAYYWHQQSKKGTLQSCRRRLSSLQ